MPSPQILCRNIIIKLIGIYIIQILIQICSQTMRFLSLNLRYKINVRLYKYKNSGFVESVWVLSKAWWSINRRINRSLNIFWHKLLIKNLQWLGLQWLGETNKKTYYWKEIFNRVRIRTRVTRTYFSLFSEIVLTVIFIL